MPDGTPGRLVLTSAVPGPEMSPPTLENDDRLRPGDSPANVPPPPAPEATPETPIASATMMGLGRPASQLRAAQPKSFTWSARKGVAEVLSFPAEATMTMPRSAARCATFRIDL